MARHVRTLLSLRCGHRSARRWLTVGRGGVPADALETAGALLRGLDQHELPCFELPPSSLSVLHSPDELYSTLLRGASGATRRVSLASLYLGVGPLERALVDALVSGAAGRRVHILLDHHRSTRAERQMGQSPPPQPPTQQPMQRTSSLTTLAPLLGCADATVHLFCPPTSPAVRLAAPWLPPFLREVFGVQHVKAAVFDDAVLLTGANLSRDYFTTRQDRYMLIEDAPRLADFVCDLLEAIGSCGTRLQPHHAHAHAHARQAEEGAGAAQAAQLQQPPPPPSSPPPAAAPADPTALAAATARVMRAARAASPPPPDGAAPRDRCWLLPSLQLASAGLEQQAASTRWLLGTAAASASSASDAEAHPPPSESHNDGAPRPSPPPPRALPLLLSSPYLNPPPQYAAALLTPPSPSSYSASASSCSSSSAHAERADGGTANAAQPPRLLLAGSPHSSSFHGAAGVRGLVPQVYAALEGALAAAFAARHVPLRLEHYSRAGWTFHAKGLWLWPPPPASAPHRHPALEAPSDDDEKDGKADGAPSAAADAAAADAATPVLTLLGSSNLGHRSVARDLELCACLVSTDGGVRAQLHREQTRLRTHAQRVAVAAAGGEGEAEPPPLVARLAARVLRGFF